MLSKAKALSVPLAPQGNLGKRDGSIAIIREYSTALAVALLKKHGDAAAEASFEHGADELAEVRDRIIAKLERMRARDEEKVQKAGQGEEALIPLAFGESPSPVRTGEGRI